MKIRILLLLAIATGIMALNGKQVQAQNPEYVWEPALSYSIKQSDRISYNAKVQGFLFPKQINSKTFTKHIEGQIAGTYKTSVDTKIGLLYQYRTETPFVENATGYEHRFGQQFGYKTRMGALRISHRIRLEQRIKDDDYENRVRYRLSYDQPLSGEKLDVGEFFWVIQNETAATFNTEFGGVENRLSTGIGQLLPDKRTYEIGLEYRAGDLFIDGAISHAVLIGTSFYLTH